MHESIVSGIQLDGISATLQVFPLLQFIHTHYCHPSHIQPSHTHAILDGLLSTGITPQVKGSPSIPFSTRDAIVDVKDTDWAGLKQPAAKTSHDLDSTFFVQASIPSMADYNCDKLTLTTRVMEVLHSILFRSAQNRGEVNYQYLVQLVYTDNLFEKIIHSTTQVFLSRYPSTIYLSN